MRSLTMLACGLLIAGPLVSFTPQAHADNDFLNHRSPDANGWGYCVFGKVVDGKDVVDRIKGVETGRRSMQQDVPLQDVIIERAEEVAGPA